MSLISRLLSRLKKAKLKRKKKGKEAKLQRHLALKAKA